MERVTLIGAEHSYFTGKAHAYLRYKGIPIRQLPASTDVYGQVILPVVGWAVIPVVADEDGTVVQDTTVIIDHFERKYANVRPVIPPGPRQLLASRALELLGDSWLTMAAMHYRWSFPEQLGFLAHEWDRMGNMHAHAHTSKAGRAEDLARAHRLMAQFSSLLPVLGVSEETIPGIEASYRAFLQALSDHLLQHRFLLGAGASVGDFGLVGPLYAHLLRDPVPGKMMKCEFPDVAEYVERLYGAAFPGPERAHHVEVNAQRVTVRDAPAPSSADDLFGVDDQVPETLLPLLRIWASEQLPMLLAVARALKEFVAALPDADRGKELPRGLGFAEFTVGGCVGQRMLQTFDAWKLQRVVDAARAHPSCAALLEEVGGAALLALDLDNCRLVKRAGAANKKSTLFLKAHVASATGASYL